MSRKTCWAVISCLFISIVIEIAVLNFRSLESLGYEQYTDFTVVDNGTEGEAEFEIKNLDCVVNNLYLNILDRTGNQLDFKIRLYATDEGNGTYYRLPTLMVHSDEETSKYIKMNLSGKAQKIKITFLNVDKDDAQNIIMETVKVNVSKPFFISWIRMASIFLLLITMYFLRPSSFIYKETYNLNRNSHQLICIVWMAIQIGIVLVLSLDNPRYIDPPWPYHHQYQNLAHSLAEGHFYLDEEPSAALLNMANPYDTQLRDKLDIDFAWDHAYYGGKYYVYFGIVPVLIFYLPFYLMTGQDFPTIQGIIICEIALIYGITLLMHTLIKRFFKKTSLGLFLLLSFLAFLSCGGIIVAKNCTFYSLPIVMGVCFVVWGLYFWISAVSEKKIKWKRIFIGSICMALVAGCRPQMLLSSFLAIPILGKPMLQAWKRKEERSQVLTVLFPYIVVAGFLMFYNYSRFGSPFDFGANYNLTTNDMTKRGFHFDRWPFGIFSFLFQPPAFSAQFPYLESARLITTYQGTTITETMYGGIFMLNPILWAGVLLFSLKQQLREKQLFAISLMCAVSGFVITLADIQMAGILIRYFSDFGIFFTIPAIIAVMAQKEKTGSPLVEKITAYVALATTIMSMLWVWK